MRFPGFEGEWETKRLGDITTWSSGGTPPKDNPLFWNGDIPWISASSMRGLLYSDSELKLTQAGLKKGSKLATKGTLLLLVRGSMLFNKIPIGVVSKDVAFNQDVKSIVVSDCSTSEYILSWFTASEPKILNMVTGTGIGAGKLDLQELKGLKIKIPPLHEQQKITAFLSLINERIDTQSKIIQRLETSIRIFRQKLFTQKNRFKNINGTDFPEWEEKKLKEISSKQIQKNNDFKVKSVLTNSAVSGIINQRDFFDKDIANDNNINGYYVVEKDDFVYNPRISNEAPVGPISRNTIGIGIMSPLYMVFRFNEINLDFIEQFYKSTIWHLHMESIANYGARADRMSFSSNDFFKMPLLLPSRKEQEAIANFLCSIENKIKTEKRILKQYEIQKKHLLQNVFI